MNRADLFRCVQEVSREFGKDFTVLLHNNKVEVYTEVNRMAFLWVWFEVSGLDARSVEVL